MQASYVSRALLECTHYKNNVHKGEISFAFMLLPACSGAMKSSSNTFF